MKQGIGIALIAVVLGAGAWLLLAKDTDRDHGHKHADKYGNKEEHHDDDHELVAKEPVRADGTFTITTSFYPLQFALERLTGDLAAVTNIGAGRDPHDFRPSTQDILTLQQSDLVVLQGAEYEPWGEDVEEQLEAESIPVLIATAELTLRAAGTDSHADEEEHHDEEEHDEHEDEDEHHDEEEDEHHEDEDEHAHGAYDPHTWLDPVLFSETVEHLTEALVTLDPENATTYEVNAATLQAELAALDTDYETTLANCTLDEVIASHDAFGYLSERYDIMIHTIGGISTQDLPSATTLAELKEEAEEGVGAILLEENSIAAYGETLAAETGLTTLPVNPIAYIIPEGADYISLMRANLETFSTALSCNG